MSVMGMKRYKVILGAMILVGVMCVTIWAVSAFAILQVSKDVVFDSARVENVPTCRAAVVLGCNRLTRLGTENLFFTRRIAAAATLYKCGKVDCLIVSGDNHRKGYDEPSDMKEALVTFGVPANKIVCDYAGFRTLDSVVRAKEVFGLKSFIVVSQPEHVRRAVFLGRAFGCDAYGFEAQDVNGRYSIKTKIREQFAKIAAVIDAVIRRSPKFLGEKVELPA